MMLKQFFRFYPEPDKYTSSAGKNKFSASRNVILCIRKMK